MRTRNQTNIEQNLNGNALVRQSRLRRTVAWLTLIAYVGQPLIVTAQVVAAPTAAANNRPVIDTTANGIPLVQIAAPNSVGLSHNQFSQYNVDPNGVILNNSNTTVLTQQAGYVSGNQNMANGTARIILNEVTGTSASQLNGYTEVAGSRAGRVMWLDFEALLARPYDGLATCLEFLHGAAPTAVLESMINSPDFGRYSKAPDHAYDARLRAQILAAARREHGSEIERGLTWLTTAGRAHPLIAEAARAAAAGSRRAP